eukprot:CAMPEP_0175049664 /NCGR_PEP_ID=MMETSP0052_2-20121109/6847_1 /TAXON_ID=51329 ORGANISM="Polytomella parva, Strain SAG 63-3" /NCGR_SAMPLE_ID=MMETSP0052_2 /ASSEMBLY_ACC=CAM_ASM_000194 /LENGTH=391 /DNA_ID=CAMNT_0016313817 /DNA_START=20 /DNA_END=1195 /DNA_ORIENTATION=-
MGDDNSGRKWLAIAATAGLTIGAGYVVYKYVLSGDDEEEQKPDIVVKAAAPKPKAGSQFAFPSSPPSVVIKEIKEPKEPKESKDPKSSHSSKNCGKCGKKLTGLPMRCSKCKAAYYCSSNCQKQAWPEHKASCKDGKTASPVATETLAPTSTVATVEAESSIAATVLETESPIAVTVSETDTAPAPEAEPAITSSADTLQGVLADLLEEQANARNGTIEGDMEKAVLHFVKGESNSIEPVLSGENTIDIDNGSSVVGGCVVEKNEERGKKEQDMEKEAEGGKGKEEKEEKEKEKENIDVIVDAFPIVEDLESVSSYVSKKDVEVEETHAKSVALTQSSAVAAVSEDSAPCSANTANSTSAAASETVFAVTSSSSPSFSPQSSEVEVDPILF